MLSYRHLFHAGSFADVMKHALLARLLLALNEKAKPWCFIDTHAGIARYDLAHEWAWKAREFENGIGRLWTRTDIPPLIKPYVDLVRAENPKGRLRFYPGSPMIAAKLRRPGDRLVLTELNRTDCAELDAVMSPEKNVSVRLLDAYDGLKGSLPPAERRGLVLIDSGFDRGEEFARITKALREAHARWPTGIYAIWYPIMAPTAMAAFARSLVQSGIRKILQLELRVAPEGSVTMPGCGLIVVNPPWKFENDARDILGWLAPVLAADGKGNVKVEWLVPE